MKLAWRRPIYILVGVVGIMVLLRYTNPANVTFQEWSWIATSLGVVITGLTALQDWGMSREQHAREFRWKKGELAMRVLDAMYADSFAKNAMTMLDWTNHEFVLPSNAKVRVRFEDLPAALRQHTSGKLEFDETQYFVRESFDHLAEHLERIEHLIDIGLISSEDLRPLRYWARRISHEDFCKLGDPVRTYFKAYDYDLALKLAGELAAGSAQSIPRDKSS